MHIVQNAQLRQLITAPALLHLTFRMFYHQKQPFYSNKASGKLSTIQYAKHPLRSLAMKLSMVSNYVARQSDSVDVQW
jgi:hypothetical protein